MSSNPLMTQTLILFDNATFRSSTMMTIKDLSTSKELDRKAMAEVRGGLNFNVLDILEASQGVESHGGIGSPAIGIQVPVLVNVDTGVEQHLGALPPVFGG
jgi:hypothetical protein